LVSELEANIRRARAATQHITANNVLSDGNRRNIFTPLIIFKGIFLTWMFFKFKVSSSHQISPTTIIIKYYQAFIARFDLNHQPSILIKLGSAARATPFS
jgi:hypothetical protein